MKAASLILAWLLVIGCAVKENGSRTLTFGPDGIKVVSETISMDADKLADVEKEKTRQICYKQQAKNDKSLFDAVKTNPFALAMWEQAKALNNAMSLIATGKPYNPCPSSTNSSDVEIADAKMYESIYDKAFSFAKFGVGAWAGTEIADSILGAVAAGGYSINLNGENSSFNSVDSFKNANIGANNALGGGVFSSHTEEIVKEEPEIGSEL